MVLNEVTALARSRKEGARHLLPGDNRSAVCKWIPDKGKREKERTLRSHLESVPRPCGCSSTGEAVSLVGESPAATCERRHLKHAAAAAAARGVGHWRDC